MKQAWIMDWTEYEFGQRPDGTSMHVDLATAQQFRTEKSVGSADQYWRASNPRLVNVSDEKYAEVVAEGGSTWATMNSWLKTQEMVA